MTDRQDYEVTGMNAGMPSQASCQWTADPAPMRLELIGVSKAFDSKVVADRIDLSVRQGEAFALLGPSGSGKSTLLRIVAGLEAADAGKVRIAGRDMAHVPPWKRNLGMVFQQYAVFPHMSVAANVGYGLKVRGRSRQEIEARVQALLRMVGLEGMGTKNASLLSGGEQQRVALARALAPEPAILLLDEPLSALDEKIRREMQGELKRIQRATGTTFIYVTHDQEEALAVSDRIAVLNRGRIAQLATPEEIFRQPATRFVAEFFRGCNVLTADFDPSAEGGLGLFLAGTPLHIDVASREPATESASLALRAENIVVGPVAETCAIRLEAQILETTYRGSSIDYALRLIDGQRLTASMPEPASDGSNGRTRVGFNPADLVLLRD